MINKDRREEIDELLKEHLDVPLTGILVKSSLSYDEKLNEVESYLYVDVLTNLSDELKEQEIKVTYSMKLLLEQAAITMVRLFRARARESNPKVPIFLKCEESFKSRGNEKHYHTIHPVTGYIEKLEKHLIYLLKQLGLLPEQVVERERILIVKRLKKKLFEIEQKGNSYEVEAVAESKQEI